MKEIWKEVPDYKDYEVSNLGRVRSNKRLIPIILKQNACSAGYLGVNLSNCNGRKRFSTHGLVAVCFLNHQPDKLNGLVIDHINRDKLDNKLVNLRLVTRRDNLSNTSRDMASEYIGVTFSKRLNKWIARITLNKKRIHLGVFQNEHEAHLAYQKALKNGN